MKTHFFMEHKIIDKFSNCRNVPVLDEHNNHVFMCGEAWIGDSNQGISPSSYNMNDVTCPTCLSLFLMRENVRILGKMEKVLDGFAASVGGRLSNET